MISTTICSQIAFCGPRFRISSRGARALSAGVASRGAAGRWLPVVESADSDVHHPGLVGPMARLAWSRGRALTSATKTQRPLLGRTTTALCRGPTADQRTSGNWSAVGERDGGSSWRKVKRTNNSSPWLALGVDSLHRSFRSRRLRMRRRSPRALEAWLLNHPVRATVKAFAATARRLCRSGNVSRATQGRG